MGAQACGQIARYLPEHGWEPVVLTVDERYLSHRDPTSGEPGSIKVYRTRTIPHPIDIYRWITSRHWPGLPFGARPVAAENPSTRSRIKRWVLSILLAPDELTGWLPIAVARGAQLVRREQISQLWSSGPSWTNHLVALALKRFTGLPWTAHFRDPWAQFRLHHPHATESRASLALERRLERTVVTNADAVVCVTDRHTDAMRAFYRDLCLDRFVTIPNGYSPDEFDGVFEGGPEPAKDRASQFAITYTGNLYIWRDLTPVLGAIRLLMDQGEIGADDIVLNLVGRCEVAQGRPVQETVKDLGLESILRAPGTVSRRRALSYMTHSDLLLLLAENLTLQVPGKTYEYLKAGRPVLALAGDGATADVIRGTGAGEVLAPADVPAIAEYIRRLVRLHRAGVASTKPDPSLVRAFDRRVLAGRFGDVFSRLAVQRTP
jgi:glycosyltransferase involved in cell wall biosynthesis